MAGTILNVAPGYRTKNFVSPEAKIYEFARILAGYDDITWNKLKRDRQLTYIRAGSAVLHSWDELERVKNSWPSLKPLKS